MVSNCRFALAALSALMLLGSCSDATGPAPGALAGRYVSTEPGVTDHGYTVAADTLVLGPDNALRRVRLLHRSVPPHEVYSWDMGSYSVHGPTVALRFSCRSGVCIGETTFDATAVGRRGRVELLVVNENGRRNSFTRVD